MRLLITQRIQDNIAGSGAGQALRWWKPGEPMPPGEDAETMSMASKILLTKSTRKDRAVWVELTDGEADTLRIYIEAMEVGGRDNAYDPDGRADMNAAVALLRKMAATR